ncbi:MAG: YqgE/AlgH family protein [Bacteroidia bacterium]|nr:YqgE/AlgH family protein [Bacteroidia bacterium]MCZ2277123.1 YqgE/AlgH family protein [Bacteroidia bacterium]
MKRQATKPKQGTLLLSDPFLHDSYFKRSVVLISEHDDQGTLGFILNKPTEIPINEALEDFPFFDSNLYFGGPVDTDSLFYIHTIGEKLNGARKIAEGIYWGGDFNDLKSMISNALVSPEHIRFYAGYAGWEPDQLKHEIKDNSWMLSKVNSHYAFSNSSEQLWSIILKSMGNKYALLANFPEDVSWN